MSLLDPAIAPLNRGLKIVGQAVTAHVFPGDGLAAYRALQLAGAGQVLVVTTAGQASTPTFAELVSVAARQKDHAGRAGARGQRGRADAISIRLPMRPGAAGAGTREPRRPAWLASS